MTLGAGFVFAVGLTLRIIIGRKIFPCGIITLSFFTLAPAIMLPTVFRMSRIYFMYRINLLKMKLFEVTKDSTRNITPSASTLQSSTSSLDISKDQLQSMNTTEMKKSDTSQGLKVAQSNEDMGLSSTADCEDLTGNEEELQADVSSWNMSENKMDKNVTNQVKQLAILNFFLSKKFILPAYVVAFCIGIAIWIILGIVEEVTYNSSTDPNKKRLFLLDGGLFVFDRGCGLTTTTMLIIGVHALFYIFLEFVFLVLAVMADRDTWGIKKETLILIIIQFIATIIFIVIGMLEVTEKLLDYLVPTGLALWMYELIEVIVGVGMPVLYAILSDRKTIGTTSQAGKDDEEKKQNLKETGIENILENKKTFEILLDFARRSYCTESVLCWRDIQRFKKTNVSNRRKAAFHILKAYLTYGAPLELNMSKIDDRRREIEKIIEENPKKIPHTLFASIQNHCLNDMTDLFERLKNSNKQIADLVKGLKELKNSVNN